MSQTRVRAAFESRLKAWADAQNPPVFIAWENVQAAPPAANALYLRAFMLPLPTTSGTLDRVHRLFRGIFQITVVAPAGTGPARAQAIADAMETVFPAQTPMPQDGIQVLLEEPIAQGPAIPDGDRYTLPMSAPYRADTV